MNTPVNFEMAKLLKEKGFDLLCMYCYDKCDMLSTYSTVFKPLNYNTSGYLKSAPTIAEVVMWLYEKHGIWSAVWKYRDCAVGCNDDYRFKHNYSGSTTFKTPTEAYSAAILYALNNLI